MGFSSALSCTSPSIMLRRSVRWSIPTEGVHSLVNHCHPELVLAPVFEVSKVRARVGPQIVHNDYALTNFTSLGVILSLGAAKCIAARAIPPQSPGLLNAVANECDDICEHFGVSPLKLKVRYRRQIHENFPEFGCKAAGPLEMHGQR